MMLDPATELLALVAALLIVIVAGVVFATRAQRRRERMAEEHPMTTPESVHDVARWIEEGRRLFSAWQERIERLDQLQNRLAAMAEEIGRLRAEVARIDELRAALSRLGQETDRLRAERAGMQEALAHIGEITRGALARISAQAGE